MSKIVSTPSRYLRQEDVLDPMLLTIADAKRENVAREDEAAEEKWVLYFREVPKGLSLNSVNTKRLIKGLGTNDAELWIGKQVVLYVDDEVEFGGKTVGGLRIRVPARPKEKSAASDVPFDDQLPPIEAYNEG